MELTQLQVLTDTHQWGVLLPETLLVVAALVILMVELWQKNKPMLSAQLAIGAQILVLGFMIGRWLAGGAEVEGSYFVGALVQNGDNYLLRMFFLFGGLIVSHLGYVYLAKRPLAKVEYFHIVLVVTAAFMVLAQVNHFIVLFVALETVTIGFFILVAYGRTHKAPLEAGLKYLVSAALSSSIMLFGMVLLYGAAGNPLLPMAASDPLSFGQLGAFLAGGDDQLLNSGNLMAIVGAVLVVAGLCFKIGAVPFQIWVPDVYQGAPTPTTAFLAVVSKAAGVYLLYLLLSGPFAALESVMVPLLSAIAIATMVFGNLAPLSQRNVKRVMGLSGVAHAGIILMGLVATYSVAWAWQAIFFYLLVYALASFAVFEVMAHLTLEDDSHQEHEHYEGLMQKNPFLGVVLAIGLGSLAGIPPLAGFVAKFLIFLAAVQAGLYVLLAVALVGVVLSIYYYFGWMRAAVFVGWMREDIKRPEPAPITTNARWVMTLLALGSIGLGLFQGGLLAL